MKRKNASRHISFCLHYARIYYNHIKEFSQGCFIQIKNIRIKVTEFIHEIGSCGDEILALQKKTGSRFYFQTTKTQRINSILKVMTKFMVSKMTQAYTQSCEQLYPIYAANTKYTIQNLSFKFEQRFFKYTIRLGVTCFQT